MDDLIQGFFSLGLLLKCLSTEKLIQARLGVSRTIYVNVDSPNLGFPYFNFLGGGQLKKSPCIWKLCKELPHSVVSSLRGYQTLPQEQTRTYRNVHNQHKNTHEQTYWSRLTHSKRDRTTHIDRGKGSKNPGQGDYNGDNVQMLTTKCQLLTRLWGGVAKSGHIVFIEELFLRLSLGTPNYILEHSGTREHSASLHG